MTRPCPWCIEDGAKGRAHWIESDDPKHLGWTVEVGA